MLINSLMFLKLFPTYHQSVYLYAFSFKYHDIHHSSDYVIVFSCYDISSQCVLICIFCFNVMYARNGPCH